MGLFPGILFGSAPAPPSADLGDANAWDLTSIVYVPTGVAVGDLGVLNDRVYQYATLTVDAGAGGGFQTLWVPPDVSAWTSPTVYAYLDGDEDATARGNQGWTDSITGSASITGDVGGTGYTRLQAETGSNNATINTLSTLVAAGSKVYVRAEMVCTPSPGTFVNTQIGIIIADGTNIVRAYQRGPTQAFALVNNGGSILSSGALASSGSPLPTSTPPALIECTDEGRTVLTSLHRDGERYHADKRTGGTSGANFSGFTTVSTSASGISWLDIRRAVIIAGT